MRQEVRASHIDGCSPRINELLATMGNDLDQGLIPLWVYNDAELYRLELERIFARTWVFVAHESEVPNRGDYVSRPIGEDPFIVVRGEDDKIRVLFDSCRHRGARVCTTDKGNARLFQCPYHGWTYTTAGGLKGVPNKATAFIGLDESQWGLHEAPRVDSYRGLIFASLDADVMPLRDFLGDFCWYLDIHLGLTEGGMEVVGAPHRWLIDADWKSGSDNFAGDSYHTQSLHQSILHIGLSSRAAAGASGGKNDIHVTECSGHSSSIRRKDAGETSFWGYPPEVYEHFNADRMTEAQFDLARRSVSHTGTVFPNLSLIHIGVTDDPLKPMAAYLSFRQWQPKGPGMLEAWSWVLLPKEASAEYKARAYKAAVATFSPSGNFEQDDSVIWSGVTRAANTVFARSAKLRLNFQMGMPGVSVANIMSDWPGPGIVYDTNLEEGVQRTFFRHWHSALRRGASV